MGFTTRSSFARGWVPDADAVNGPVDGLLRMDNLTLDELGAVSLRGGSTVLSSLAELDVHSLFTAVLAGTRARFAGAGDGVYLNGAAIANSLAGSDDVAFGAHQGQVLFARSTSKYKHDGTTRRTWGIPMTGAAPTVVAVAPDKKTFATCASTESPAFTISEDDGTGATFATGEDGTANAAIVVHPAVATGRATLSRRYAAATDFTVYDGATVGQDSDLLTLFVYVTEPANLLAIDVMVDVNAGSTNPFQDDYYVGSFTTTAEQILTTPATDVPAETPALNSPHVRQGPANNPTVPVVGVAVSRIRNDKPISNAGWTKLAIPRSQMHRVGASAGKDWTTVIGIRLIVTAAVATAVRFDQVQIEAARMLGPYTWRYRLAYNTGVYVALSPLSAASAEYTLQSQAATVTVPADAARDTQANEIWVYRIGGVMPALFRSKVKTGVSGLLAVVVTDDVNDLDVLTINIAGDTSDQTPPDNIVAVEGPYFDRTFVLTSDGFLWPSRRLNPDTFSSGQAIRVSAPDERAFWVKKAFGGLYVGTSRDIYRISGDGAEFPDGSVNFTKDPLNLDHPPISDGLAHDGNLLIYISDDGWRSFTGQASASIAGDTSLLYRGQTRHEVEPVNLETGRFRAAIGKGQLLAITPEGDDDTSSVTIYRHAPLRGGWYRHTYPRAWRSIVREPDGTVLAGDTAGVVWVLDSGTDDGGTAIPVEFWTRADDLGDPFHDKVVSNVHVRGDLGDGDVAIGVYANGEAGSTASTGTPAVTTSTESGIVAAGLTDLPECRQVQIRLTGSTRACRVTAIGVTARPVPIGVLAWDSGPVDLGGPELVWLRGIRVKAHATANLAIETFFDGVSFGSLTVTPITLTDPSHVTSWGRRGVKGRVGRVVITSRGVFRPYWVEFIRRETGRVSDKRSVKVQAEG